MPRARATFLLRAITSRNPVSHLLSQPLEAGDTCGDFPHTPLMAGQIAFSLLE